jgi:hypothetical protein
MRSTATETAVPGAASVEDQPAAFFDAHYERMVRLAGLVCRSGVLAEDAVQAAMEQAWRRRSSLRDPGRMRWWLDRIVVREAIRMNRRPWWSRLTATHTDEHASLLPDPAGETTPQRMALTAAFRAHQSGGAYAGRNANVATVPENRAGCVSRRRPRPTIDSPLPSGIGSRMLQKRASNGTSVTESAWRHFRCAHADRGAAGRADERPIQGCRVHPRIAG